MEMIQIAKSIAVSVHPKLKILIFDGKLIFYNVCDSQILRGMFKFNVHFL